MIDTELNEHGNLEYPVTKHGTFGDQLANLQCSRYEICGYQNDSAYETSKDSPDCSEYFGCRMEAALDLTIKHDVLLDILVHY